MFEIGHAMTESSAISIIMSKMFDDTDLLSLNRQVVSAFISLLYHVLTKFYFKLICFPGSSKTNLLEIGFVDSFSQIKQSQDHIYVLIHGCR